MKKTSLFIVLLLQLSSCIVQSPKYTSFEQIKALKLGMSKGEVEKFLGVEAYNLKALTDTSEVYIYVYRVIDRRTLAGFTEPTNGKKTQGKYMQMEVAYSLEGKVINIESCTLCPDNLVTTSKINFEKILAFITVTLPVILVYIGFQNN